MTVRIKREEFEKCPENVQVVLQMIHEGLHTLDRRFLQLDTTPNKSNNRLRTAVKSNIKTLIEHTTFEP